MSTMNAEKPVKRPESINAQELITITARMAQLLAEEVDLLRAMKISKIQDLQEEKQVLIRAMESHRKLLEKHPHLVDTIPSRDRRDLEGVVKVFENILEENHQRLLMAREVNRQVVQVISQVVREASQSNVYDGSGTSGALGNDAVSITLNQTA